MTCRRLFKRCLIFVLILLTVSGLSAGLSIHTNQHGTAAESGAREHVLQPEVTRYYVARSGDGSDGLSWQKAFPHVQAALVVAAATGGGEIWVAKGVYYPDESWFDDNSRVSTFMLQNNIKLYGGFDIKDTKLSDRDWEKNLTVLSGDIDGDDFTNADEVVVNTDNINGNNAYHVVTAENIDNSAVIDGFFITAGNADGTTGPIFYGGGLYCDAASSGYTCNPILKNIHFSGNSANSGGAVHFDIANGGTSSPILENLTFSNNSSVDIGGAFRIWGACEGNSEPILTNITFYNNKTTEHSGGAMGISSLGKGCQISPILTNVVCSGNYAFAHGGAMYTYSGYEGKTNPILINVTFSGNKAGKEGGAIYNVETADGDNVSEVRNSILWNNMDISGTGTISSSIFHRSYNDIKSIRTYIVNSIVQGTGNSGSGSWIDDDNFVDGGGNKDTDPLFKTPVNPNTAPTTNGNLRLTKDSPAVDMGNNSLIPVLYDLDNNPRRVDGDGNGIQTVDMGAYEYQVPYIYDISLPLILN